MYSRNRQEYGTDICKNWYRMRQNNKIKDEEFHQIFKIH